MEKDIACKQKKQIGRGSNSHIRLDFKTKAINKRQRGALYIMIKGSIQKEDIMLINI